MSEEKQQSNEMDVDENNGISADVPMEIAPLNIERDLTTSTNSNNACRVMASSGTVGSVSISLHPLVIMNVSEHWTRLRAQEGSDQLGEICHFFSISFLINKLYFKSIFNNNPEISKYL